MSHLQKPWINEIGECATDAEIRVLAKNWNARTWADFLKSTVDIPQREIPSPSEVIEGSLHQGVYQDMLSKDEYPHLQQLIVTLLKRLTMRERAVIHSAYWLGRSQCEIAQELNITRATVRQYRDRALKKLGALLFENVHFPEEFDPKKPVAGRHKSTQKAIGTERAS